MQRKITFSLLPLLVAIVCVYALQFVGAINARVYVDAWSDPIRRELWVHDQLRDPLFYAGMLVFAGIYAFSLWYGWRQSPAQNREGFTISQAGTSQI